MLRRATNLTVAERFQPCIVGEAVVLGGAVCGQCGRLLYFGDLR
jgi:hypothetical protein